MHVGFSRFVRDDVEDIADWIADDNPGRAETFVQEIWDAIDLIGEQPFLYQLRPDIGEAARLKTVGRYVILFWIDGDEVRIERVVFGGRDLAPLYAQ
jgi:plasmid stabilization system protein ParE